MVNEEPNSHWYTEARVDELLAEKDAAIAELRAKVEEVANGWVWLYENTSGDASLDDCARELRAVLEGGQ